MAMRTTEMTQVSDTCLGAVSGVQDTAVRTEPLGAEAGRNDPQLMWLRRPSVRSYSWRVGSTKRRQRNGRRCHARRHSFCLCYVVCVVFRGFGEALPPVPLTSGIAAWQYVVVCVLVRSAFGELPEEPTARLVEAAPARHRSAALLSPPSSQQTR